MHLEFYILYYVQACVILDLWCLHIQTETHTHRLTDSKTDYYYYMPTNG